MKKTLAILFTFSLLLASVLFFDAPASAASMGPAPQVGYLTRKTKKVAHRTKTGTKYVAHKTKVGTKKTYSTTKRGTKKTYSKSKHATKKTYVKTKNAVTN